MAELIFYSSDNVGITGTYQVKVDEVMLSSEYWGSQDFTLRGTFNHLASYLKYDVDITKNNLANRNRAKVKRVIFNGPATIILWSDNTKTIVQCQPGDTPDAEKGFVMAYLKKMLGNDNTFNKEIKHWVYGEK